MASRIRQYKQHKHRWRMRGRSIKEIRVPTVIGGANDRTCADLLRSGSSPKNLNVLRM